MTRDINDRALKPVHLVAELPFERKACFETYGYWWMCCYGEEKFVY